MCVSHLYVSDCVLQCCWIIHKVRTQGECWNLQQGEVLGLSCQARHFFPLGLSYIQRTCVVFMSLFPVSDVRGTCGSNNQRPLHGIFRNYRPQGLCVKVQQLPLHSESDCQGWGNRSGISLRLLRAFCLASRLLLALPSQVVHSVIEFNKWIDRIISQIFICQFIW